MKTDKDWCHSAIAYEASEKCSFSFLINQSYWKKIKLQTKTDKLKNTDKIIPCQLL